MAAKAKTKAKPAKQRETPLRLTPSVRRTLVAALAAGSYRTEAARYAGVGIRSFYRWLERGKADQEAGRRSPCRALLEAIEKAEADAEVRALAQISKASTDDWRAAAWKLERKNPERWGDRRQLQVGGTVEHHHQHSLVQRGILQPGQQPVDLPAAKRRAIAQILSEGEANPADQEQEEEVLTGEVVPELPVRAQPRQLPVRIDQPEHP
jgi:hypothetical protein